ncbi:hypothetical protein IMG5_147090 [Ichthyophthirius multifiliis]|uniref:Uncharacterized protein n=1 Tax=Ichthyophthirius multifiliis TaxID=5932 RepID=G0QY40_ICHMU|nr:hypothetical protein IMG5_147090 [Ichthyophthirius multifiliis]EGR29866.1 hypothetical protein IMG5_147090 [Ichthyophthirius multifiliis]|eukprot:XP_004031102.1 hypothetical protein IMG5_147090 [Ichthyophthirius multifiliis]
MLSITKIQINDNQINQKDDTDIVSSICRKNPKDIFKLYCRLLNVIEKCDELDALIESRLIQEEVFEQITKEIRDLPDENVSQPKSIYNIIQENMVTFIPEYPYCTFDPIQKFNINQQLQKQSTMKQIQQQKQNNPIKAFQSIKEEYDQIYQTIYFPLAEEGDSKRKKDVLNKLKEKFFNNDKINQIPLYQEPHRFIVMGGDAELHGFIQFIGELFCEYEEKKVDMKKLDLRIFLVPCKKSTLAHFIASKDVWYQRYLYIPFNEETLIPKYEHTSETGKINQQELFFSNENKNNITLPYKLRLDALHTYVREANRAFNVRVYKINCTWNDESIQQKNVFFCQYVEIGEPVEAEKFIMEEIKFKLLLKLYSLQSLLKILLLMNKKIILFQFLLMEKFQIILRKLLLNLQKTQKTRIQFQVFQL